MKNLIGSFIGKIPAEKKDNVFTLLLSIVKEHNIASIEQLHNYLDTDIGMCQKWLDENKEGDRINAVRREYAKKLAELKDVKDLVNRYL